MKRTIIFLITAFFILSAAAGCGKGSGSKPIDKITSYKEIPGVNQADINAVEALKARYDKFIYGAMYSTEVFERNGSYAGFTPEFCKLLSNLFGIEFEIEECDWENLENELKSSVDFTGELTPTDDRVGYYYMTHPIAERLLKIFMREDNAEIKFEFDIKGMTIGFLKRSVNDKTIKKAYPVSFDAVEAETLTDAARMVRDRSINAFVCESSSDPAFDNAEGEINITSLNFFPTVHSSVSMATANSELEPIIKIVNKYIEAGGIDVLYKLYKDGDYEYAKNKLNKSFSLDEKKYLGDNKKVRVHVEHDNYPVSFYNEKEKKFQGMAVDVLYEIGRLTDIEFEIVSTKNTTWDEIKTSVENNIIPMATQILITDDRRDWCIWTDVPYGRSYYAFISKADFPDLASFQVVQTKVSVLIASGKITVYKNHFPQNNNLEYYPTQNDCLDALERGEVDLFFASEYALLYQTHLREKAGFKVNLRLNVPMDSHFGFNKNQKELKSIFDKAQQFVNMEGIESNWTGIVFDYSKKLTQQRVSFMTGFIIVLIGILIVTLLLLAVNIRLSKKLKEIAEKDALTGIMNRRRLMELSVLQIERSLRKGDENFCIIFDLDHFKKINDSYGHIAGDKVLREISKRVEKAIRPGDLFGRYGGEEFILLVANTNKENVINTAERIRREIYETPIEFEDKRITVSASFGIAHAAPINDIRAATKHADEALYRAKKEGRNRVVFYGENET